ncbi:MAG TPA: hypothetical protein RMH26_04145, partial [Polyangiaceae bacterium LLY-WYZ-15_(1-7)]|nr:hypothetical protein [Polyangiaceae bacterium LLY-WYZ-15_(1-7)]
MNAPRVPLALMLLAACGPCGGAPHTHARKRSERRAPNTLTESEGPRVVLTAWNHPFGITSASPSSTKTRLAS